jgi:hypothetical protein
MQDQDCYFLEDPDPDVPEEKRHMIVLCMSCREKHFPDQGWFYQGSKDGYGPFDFICDRCGEVIHKHEEDESEEDYDD